MFSFEIIIIKKYGRIVFSFYYSVIVMGSYLVYNRKMNPFEVVSNRIGSGDISVVNIPVIFMVAGPKPRTGPRLNGCFSPGVKSR